MATATTVQRDVSPIPPGRYWIDLVGEPLINDFDGWIRDMQGAARVEASELDKDRFPVRSFVIFTVPEGRKPFLDAGQFGFPRHAPPGVDRSSDVIHEPVIPGPSFPSFNLSGGGLALLALLALLAFKS